MIFKKYGNIGSFGSNNYLLVNEFSHEAALVDCTGDFDEISKDLKEYNANLRYILLTHAHFDHIVEVSEFVNHIKNPDGSKPMVCLHKEDEILLDNIATQCAFFGLDPIERPKVDIFIDENSDLNLGLEGSAKIEILHTPGHTRGSVGFIIDNKLFSGDTLFYEEIGRCDLPGGDFKQIEKSIREKLFTLPEDMPVYPGHGIESTIGHEKEFNCYFGKNSRYV